MKPYQVAKKSCSISSIHNQVWKFQEIGPKDFLRYFKNAFLKFINQSIFDGVRNGHRFMSYLETLWNDFYILKIISKTSQATIKSFLQHFEFSDLTFRLQKTRYIKIFQIWLYAPASAQVGMGQSTLLYQVEQCYSA